MLTADEHDSYSEWQVTSTPSAGTDMVRVAAVDNGAGNSSLQIVPEAGNKLRYGNSILDTVSGNLTLDAAAIMNVGTATQTTLNIGRTTVDATLTGGTVTLSVDTVCNILAGTSAQLNAPTVTLGASAGAVVYVSGGTSAGLLRVYEASGNGTHAVGLKAADSLAATTDYTLPSAFPAVTGYVLSSTDAGVMSWTTTTGSGNVVLASSPTITTPTISGAISFPDNVTQTFNPGADNAGINVGSHAGDPATPDNGDVWYDSTANELTARINGANVALGSGGTSALLSATHTDTVANAVTRGSLIYGNSTPAWDELVIGAANKVLTSDGTDAAWTSPDWQLLSSASANSDATVAFTLTGWTNGDYMAYMVVIANLHPETDVTEFRLRTSTDGGSSYDAGASDYRWADFGSNDTGASAGAGDGADSEIRLHTGYGNAANETSAGNVLIYRPSAAIRATITYQMMISNDGGTLSQVFGSGQRLATADVDAIQFLFSSGDIGTGEFRLYGLKNA